MINPILRKLRRLEAVNKKILSLCKERDEMEKVVIDMFPVQEGDEFDHHEDYCGIITGLSVVYDIENSKASLEMEYYDEGDQVYRYIYDVNPKYIRKTTKKKKK